MSPFNANIQKKGFAFHKRETELRHAIQHEFSSEKIAEAAERLREAKFSLFKARFHNNSLNPPYAFTLADGAKKDKGIAKWVNMTTQEIIAEYSKSRP